MLKKSGRKLALAFAVCAVTALTVVQSAFAAAQDYSSVGTAATAEINAVIPIALGILALVIGIPMAIRVLKRISH